MADDRSDAEDRSNAEDQARLFTLAEARATLPRLEPLLRDVQDAKETVLDVQALIQSVRRSGTTDGDAIHSDTTPLEAQLRGLAQRMRRTLGEITEIGVVIKDIDRGLVDWVAMRDGHRVYICWELGEAEIGWWHEIAAGFAGRQAIVTEEWA